MNFPRKQNLRVPASYCFKFHKGGHCHSCAYSHNNYCFKSDGNQRLCQQQLNIFLEFCSYLGFPIAPEKTCGPSTTLSFVGIALDTVLKDARLPQDKLDKCVTTIWEFGHRKKVTLCELQSLIGPLNFECSVVQPGRGFLRRLIDLTIGIKLSSHKIGPWSLAEILARFQWQISLFRW